VHDKVFYSPYFKGLLGYADGEFANTVAAFKNVLHPEDVARVEEAIEKHLYDQIPYSIEYRLKRKTGDYHWFYAKGMALWNDKGQPTRMAGSLLDITDRKRAEQRLAAQYAVTQLLSEADSIEKIAEKIIQSVGENLEWDFGSLWVVDNQENVMRSVGVWHQPGLDASALSKATRNMALAIGEGLPGRVWQTGQYIWLSDVIADKTFSRIAEAKAANLHSVFCFPIRIENKVLGALEFLVQRRQGADDVMLKMMAAITVQIGFFMQRKIAEKQFNERDYHV
jgi:PAS domain S-box-containing protein